MVEFRIGKRFSEAFIDGTEIDVQHRDNSYAEVGWEHKHYFGAAQLDSTLAYRWGVRGSARRPIFPGSARRRTTTTWKRSTRP